MNIKELMILITLAISFSGCCNKSTHIPNMPYFPQKVKTFMNSDDPEIHRWAVDMAIFKCNLLVATGEESKKCKEILNGSN